MRTEEKERTDGGRREGDKERLNWRKQRENNEGPEDQTIPIEFALKEERRTLPSETLLLQQRRSQYMRF